jgi:hypothetical protein
VARELIWSLQDSYKILWTVPCRIQKFAKKKIDAPRNSSFSTWMDKACTNSRKSSCIWSINKSHHLVGCLATILIGGRTSSSPRQTPPGPPPRAQRRRSNIDQTAVCRWRSWQVIPCIGTRAWRRLATVGFLLLSHWFPWPPERF